MTVADNENDPTAEIRSMVDRLNLTEYRPPADPYEADEPRDTKMAAFLMEQFKRPAVRDAEADYVGTTPVPVVPDALLGEPVEWVARRANLDWLRRVSELIQTQQRGDPRFGPASDWVIVCSVHLFEHWEKIEHIPVIHSPVLLPWTVYLMRSMDWWTRRLVAEASPVDGQDR